MFRQSKSLSMTALLFVGSSLLACSGAAEPNVPRKSEAVGPVSVTTEAEGDNVVTKATATRSDDELTVTFERKTQTAKLEPHYGQARSVPLTTFPTDLEAAHHFVAEPLAYGNEKASTSGGGTRTATVNVPPPACANPCFDACDGRFPDPAQNTACRFGCSNGCTN